MGKLLMLVLGLSLMGFLAYKTMYGRVSPSGDVESPKKRLDNVQNAANRIEDKDDARLKQIEANTTGD